MIDNDIISQSHVFIRNNFINENILFMSTELGQLEENDSIDFVAL